jgi:[ribulose-bisphosphate carboxylase]-lysine N-methyltransferase
VERRRLYGASCSAHAEAQVLQAVTSLSTWIEERGVSAKKLNVNPDVVEDELSLVVTRPVAKGQAVAAVPSSAWITQKEVGKSGMGKLVRDLEPWLQIALFLLHERSKSDSSWQQYLDTLPSEPDVPLFWSDDELSELQGTQLLSSVEGYRSPMTLLCAGLILRGAIQRGMFGPRRLCLW